MMRGHALNGSCLRKCAYNLVTKLRMQLFWNLSTRPSMMSTAVFSQANISDHNCSHGRDAQAWCYQYLMPLILLSTFGLVCMQACVPGIVATYNYLMNSSLLCHVVLPLGQSM